ncbi:MAG TPA: GDP-mannose 4,6-dehydratase, partial [Pseudomonadales bacterium]|nr:GDP-mannose 4,6-dehydratase [Pseudomonadales bacterium]
KVDLADRDALLRRVAEVQPHYVVHLAALAFVGHSDQKAFYDVNLFGTLNLLEAVNSVRDQLKKVIVASSANIYGTPAIRVIDESICPAPVNHYSVSKLAMEHMVKTWFERLPIVIVRPFNYTGPGQDDRFVIPKIVNHYRRAERKIELGNLNVARDFSDVRDVVTAYVQLLQTDVQSDVFNVCSGQAYSLQDVMDIMRELAGYEIEISVNPAFVRPNEIPFLQGSYAKLANRIGYKPSYSLKETLAAMYLQGESIVL